jgi:hypothetical protein
MGGGGINHMHTPPVSVEMCYVALAALELADRFIPSSALRNVILLVKDDPNLRNAVIETLKNSGAVIPMGEAKGRQYRLSAHGKALLESYRKWYPEPDGTLLSNALEMINGPVQDGEAEL